MDVPELNDYLKERPMLSAVVGLFILLNAVSLASNITSAWKGMHYIDSLVTADAMAAAIASERQTAAAELKVHTTQADARLEIIEKGLNRVRAFTELVPQIRNLLTLRCMGTRGLDDTIVDLERQYGRLTGETFAEQSCERLLAVR